MKTIHEYFEESGNTWIPQILFNKLGLKQEDLAEEKVMGVTCYSTFEIQRMEEEIAKMLVEKLHEEVKIISEEECNFYIDAFEERENMKLAMEQRDAVYVTLNNPIAIITGGPGTGKTCVLKAVSYIMEQLNKKRILFCAPTGKAARRITESTGKKAQTVQKAMAYSPKSNYLKPLSADLIINDESSMLDMETTYYFLKSVAKGSKILFVGDVEQLPSVGKGAVLRDLIDSTIIPCVKLTETFRQSEDSGLFENIKRVKRGQEELLLTDDFSFIEESSKDIQTTLIGKYLEKVEQYGKDNVICLTPYRRKGDTCSNVLNAIFQDILNPIGKRPFLKAEVVESGDTQKRKVIFQVGDPVMQLENRLECANGDVGKIKAVNEKGVLVEYIDCEVFYPIKDLGQITLAYAMSVHKSQGSEYPCVVMPLLAEHKEMLNRNMLYTAITRAKKEETLLGDKRMIPKALQIEAGYERITNLAEEIKLQERSYNLCRKIA